jgi:hypothetical protein
VLISIKPMAPLDARVAHDMVSVCIVALFPKDHSFWRERVRVAPRRQSRR